MNLSSLALTPSEEKVLDTYTREKAQELSFRVSLNNGQKPYFMKASLYQAIRDKWPDIFEDGEPDAEWFYPDCDPAGGYGLASHI